jgi:hypothetical protein
MVEIDKVKGLIFMSIIWTKEIEIERLQIGIR